MSAYIRSQARLRAVETASTRHPRPFARSRGAKGELLTTSDYFGCNTFSFEAMEESLPKKDVAILRQYARSRSTPLSIELADKVALAVKKWAMQKGATHYCHWFQPHTGATAEKHDSFFSFFPGTTGVETFTGAQLIQSEPDASSFPSGGARATFEARGYTGWDASSPMFLMETDNGLTLCIPSVFISYSGEALDKKTPLLRSTHAISDKAVEALALLGHPADYVVPTCGPEQEYFVVDKAFHTLRPDLLLAKRTLIGRPPPKGQQMEDHYFGSINARILAFMMEVEHELYKLGVPVKTRHNEVAPHQFEMAPTFEYANIAADHNQISMEVLRSVAKKHDLVVLFHEKPFADVNGSGKHVNWSLMDSNGNNLLEPTDDPDSNIRFLYFLTACIKAVCDNGDLLRSAVASAGNDFRLGANEAPPAIMSVFLGESLTAVLDRLEGKDAEANHFKKFIDLSLANVPQIAKDTTDRNRTSPFAFTGNKFEFRACGSSASISPSLTYINGTVAYALDDMNKRLKTHANNQQPNHDQILHVIREVVKESRKVCFEGNNYSEEWHREAAQRGLPNNRNTVEAIQVLKLPRVKKLLTELGIMSASEVDFRYNIVEERYIKLRLIELETMREMIATQVLPAAYAQLENLKQAKDQLTSIHGEGVAEMDIECKKIGQAIKELLQAKHELTALLNRCRENGDHAEVAKTLADDGLRQQEKARAACDTLELIVDDFLWSLPKYREMLYIL